MNNIVATVVDFSVFVGLSWAIWRVLGRAIPIAVLPIIIGLVLVATDTLPSHWGLPSAGGEQIGWIGVLLLAFTAGLETRQSAHIPSSTDLPPASAGEKARFLTSAMLALLIPFLLGSVAAYIWFDQLPGWSVSNRGRIWSALGLGLCIAVSALPVLIGVVRELGPLHRPLSRIALRLAVIDDAALWIGLAILLFAAAGRNPLAGSLLAPAAALVVFVALGVAAFAAHRSRRQAPIWALVVGLPLILAAGAWSSSELGLHALLGAYFAGAIVPPAWASRLPVERIGQCALLVLAPLFFGHSGLSIDGSVLGWASLQASLLLLVLSVAAKLAALLLCPPAAWLTRRESLAVGVLLQCKGLMEIVAATVLRDKGLISEHAFAALITLAVLSTLITGPTFRWIVRKRKLGMDNSLAAN
jgi:Kef-type K+ transport system membrane component KefB